MSFWGHWGVINQAHLKYFNHTNSFEKFVLECWNEDVKYTKILYGSVRYSGLWLHADPLHPELELGMSLNTNTKKRKRK